MECKKGSLPTFTKDYDEEEDLPSLPPVTPSDPEIEVGDRIFAVMNDTPELTICATATISQWLAEAHHKNSALPDIIPDYLRDLHKVFAKESFDVLPELSQWDHAIELIPDAVMKTCKVYPMSATEIKELDAFLHEHLASSQTQ